MALDLEKLKAAQDKYNASRDDLLAKVTNFRIGFLDRLRQFAQDADIMGLEGVTGPEILSDSSSLFEVTVTVAKWKVTLAASDRVFPIAYGRSALAAKLFGYLWATDDATPFLVYSFIDTGTGGYNCRVEFLGPERIVSKGTWPVIDAETGCMGAEALIEVLYGFLREWKERPLLGDIRHDEDVQRPPFGLLALHSQTVKETPQP